MWCSRPIDDHATHATIRYNGHPNCNKQSNGVPPPHCSNFLMRWGLLEPGMEQTINCQTSQVIKARLLWLASLVTDGWRKREGGRSSLTSHWLAGAPSSNIRPSWLSAWLYHLSSELADNCIPLRCLRSNVWHGNTEFGQGACCIHRQCNCWSNCWTDRRRHIQMSQMHLWRELGLVNSDPGWSFMLLAGAAGAVFLRTRQG